MAPQSEMIALVDMDGTITDYDAALQRDLKCLASPGEPPWGQGHPSEVAESPRRPHPRASKLVGEIVYCGGVNLKKDQA